MQSVCVLMSTYNGAKFLREQMNSLMEQRGVDLHVVIRDDGSTDDTCDIIKREYPEVELRQEENIGCEASFSELLYSAPDSDYYAFCDQDDVWKEDKLECAVAQLSGIDGPAIYGCNLLACDEELQPIKAIHDAQSIERMRAKKDVDHVFNMHGCVLVWNRALQELIESFRPTRVFAHDVWVNAIGNAVGEMVIDETPHIFYRLHGNNVSGLATGHFARLKKGLRLYFGKNHPQRDLLAKEVLQGYSSHMNQSTIAYQELVLLANYKKKLAYRFAYMKSHSIRSKKMPDRFFWAICVLLGCY